MRRRSYSWRSPCRSSPPVRIRIVVSMVSDEHSGEYSGEYSWRRPRPVRGAAAVHMQRAACRSAH
eukprot:scaffold36065_cov54-Phaeocystis_antarctica.AAC.1